MNLYKLGPWPLGVDNVQDAKNDVFQNPSRQNQPPAVLREAVNVDLDSEGNVRRRQGRTKRLTLTSGHSGASVGGMFLLVDNGSLTRVFTQDFRTEVISTGLGPNEVSYCEHAGDVWWSNGSVSGRIKGGKESFWGIKSCDPPVLSTTTGALNAGRYMVATTCEISGVESGCVLASVIDVPAGGGINVTPMGVDSRADKVNVYCTSWNGTDLYWVGESVSKISSTPTSLDILDGLGAYPPPPGQLVRSFQGRILVAADNILFWSEALAPHRFRIGSDFQVFASRIVLLEPTDGGFFIAIESGPTWFVKGDDPDTWQPNEVYSCPTCEGSAVRIEGRKLPWANVDAIVPVWATRDGWAAGLPNGTVKFPTDGRIAMDTNTKASLAFREENGLRQILMSARDKTASSRFGASDIASVKIYKADGTVQ